MNSLLDTCVVSELANRRPNAQVVDWLRRQDPDTLYLSCITIGELRKGIAKLGPVARAAALENWLRTSILGPFASRILPVGREVALEWGRLCGEAERAGRKRPAIDALIAATASVHNLCVVTRNVDDMSGMGVPLFNPFSSN